MAARIAAHYGRPQDIEWAIDTDGQAVAAAGAADDRPARTGRVRPPPGRACGCATSGSANGCPRRSPRCSARWLLPVLEAGYLDGMHSCIGVRVPFRWALVHDWYYTATPIPSPRAAGPRGDRKAAAGR